MTIFKVIAPAFAVLCASAAFAIDNVKPDLSTAGFPNADYAVWNYKDDAPFAQSTLTSMGFANADYAIWNYATVSVTTRPHGFANDDYAIWSYSKTSVSSHGFVNDDYAIWNYAVDANL